MKPRRKYQNARIAIAVTMALLLVLSRAALSSELTLSPLVEPQWLDTHRHREELVLLDVRSSIDNGDAVPFKKAHIPGSVHSDYSREPWRVESSGTPGMRPDPEELEELIGSLGISNDSVVVIIPAGTGPTDFGSAARVYWTLKSAGLDRVVILNGGLRSWRARGLPMAKGEIDPDRVEFHMDWSDRWLATLDEVNELVTASTDPARRTRLIDARPEPYFRGERKSWLSHRAGTLPQADNIEHSSLVTRRDGAFLINETQIRTLLSERGLNDPEQPLITFCTSGHWASTDWFVLSEVAGFKDVRLYDGSMTQWTEDSGRPVANGRRGIERALDWF